MRKKPTKKPERKSTLQTLEAVPITDPEVQAAVDRLFDEKNPEILPILRTYPFREAEQKK